MDVITSAKYFFLHFSLHDVKQDTNLTGGDGRESLSRWRKNWESIMRGRHSWGRHDLIEIWLRGREH